MSAIMDQIKQDEELRIDRNKAEEHPLSVVIPGLEPARLLLTYAGAQSLYYELAREIARARALVPT